MDPRYLIGVPEMDAQHAKLLELAAKAKTIGDDEFEVNALILELTSYAESHLDQEEAFLKKNGLVDFEREHSKKHVLFRSQAMEFYDQFREADSAEMKVELLKKIGTFCESWLLEHINIEDRQYAALLHRRG